MADEPIYHGERTCQASFKSGKPCDRKAYYRLGTQIRCGTHSNKFKDERTVLPKNPREAEIKAEFLRSHQAHCDEVAEANRKAGRRGEVTSTKFNRYKPPVFLPGFVCVFPNFKHGGRTDGYGCRTLSPKYLGPVDHGMPGLPVADTIEIYHQGAKHWDFEFDDHGQVLKRFKELRPILYTANDPKRHKWTTKELEEFYAEREDAPDKNKNIPKCSIYYGKDGSEHRYGYLECRYFYCHWYERLAPLQEEYAHLEKMLNDGYNLNLVGYDGYTPRSTSGEDLWVHYNDTSRPFGHELVLLTLLVIDDPKDYPWNRFYRENHEEYEGVI